MLRKWNQKIRKAHPQINLKLDMAENIKCKLLCHKQNNPMNWSVEESEKVASRIEHEYFVHL